MAGKRALVTGAAKRLGRAMALYLAGRGYDIALHYASSQEAAEATAEEIRDLGRDCAPLQADLLDEAQVSDLIARGSEALGGALTVLVNNASIFENDNIESATRKSWDRHVESNLRAPFVLTQEFGAQCPRGAKDERGEMRSAGLVVNMLDQRIHKLTPDFMSYTVAKMGLYAFTRTAAMGLAPHIRVNAIAPGPTLIGYHQTEEHFARQRAATILQRGSNPEDICGALGFFLDAPGVTGQAICVDGGQHLAWKTSDIIGAGV